MMLTVESDPPGGGCSGKNSRRRVGAVGAVQGLLPQSGAEGTGAPSRGMTEVMTGTEMVEIQTMSLVMGEQRGRYQKLSFGF